MDSTRPWNYFCKQAGLYKINNRNCIKRVFVCFLSQLLHCLSRLSSKKVENNSLWFLNWLAEGKLVMNNKDDRLFMSRDYRLIVAPWKFDVLKTSIFALEASLLGQIFVLRTSNFRGATISRYSSSTETLYCLNSVSPRTNTIASCDQFKPMRIRQNLVVNYNCW